jgi:hypothetical protein
MGNDLPSRWKLQMAGYGGLFLTVGQMLRMLDRRLARLCQGFPAWTQCLRASDAGSSREICSYVLWGQIQPEVGRDKNSSKGWNTNWLLQGLAF